MTSLEGSTITKDLSDHEVRWSGLAARSGFVDYLSPEDGFKTCLKSGRKWINKDRPGIYFWLAEDGEGYIGQSVAPQSRLRQHVRDHGDVVRACFMPCALSDLSRVEEQLIADLQGEIPLRNIKWAISTAHDVPFDELVDATQRERFLAGGELDNGEWKAFDELTRLKTRTFAEFLKRAGGPEALSAARMFIHRAIPRPAATEISFWSLTLFPRTCFIRVNAGQQEIFTAEGYRGGCDVRVLSDKRISLWRSRKAPYRVPSYVTGLAGSELDKWLEGNALQSCRRLVVRLMRHTTTLNSTSHCPQAVRPLPPVEA